MGVCPRKSVPQVHKPEQSQMPHLTFNLKIHPRSMGGGELKPGTQSRKLSFSAQVWSCATRDMAGQEKCRDPSVLTLEPTLMCHQNPGPSNPCPRRPRKSRLPDSQTESGSRGAGQREGPTHCSSCGPPRGKSLHTSSAGASS